MLIQDVGKVNVSVISVHQTVMAIVPEYLVHALTRPFSALTPTPYELQYQGKTITGDDVYLLSKCVLWCLCVKYSTVKSSLDSLRYIFFLTPESFHTTPHRTKSVNDD